MTILIACEFSGVVRDAFIERGHDAVSCDLLPSEREGPHIQGDVREWLRKRWAMVIAFPPCTYLCNSGVRWLFEKDGRWDQLREGAAFSKGFFQANSPLLAIENPTMHKYAIELVGSRPLFAVQPYEFGHPESKRTCFWGRGVPPLMPTQIVRERSDRIHRVPPGTDR